MKRPALCACGRPVLPDVGGTGIRAKRIRAGALLVDVARLAGISKGYLAMMERGDRQCSGAMRDRVLAAIEGRAYQPPPKAFDFDETPMGAGL